jgi:hypothetical protein
MQSDFEKRFEQLKQQAGSQVAAPAVSTLKEGGGLSFVTPTELVDLPSKGQYYPEGHPLKDKENVEIRQMTAKEEDILTNKSFIKKGVVIDKLVESVLVDKSIDVSSLLVGDKNAIMIALRISGYGPEYDVGLVCLECGNKNQKKIDLSLAEVYDSAKIGDLSATNEELKHERLPNGSVLIQLPRTGWYVECRLLNGSDEKRLLNYVEAKRKGGGTDELTLTEQLFMIVDSINGITDKEQLVAGINKMPAYDAKHLRTVYQKLIPNIKIMSKYNCSACLAEQEVEVPFTQEFFWPK